MRRHPREISGAHAIPTERARARVSAYVYGNILVLGAVATATPHTLHNGHAALVVVATTVTTYAAHVLAHAVGRSVGEEEDPETNAEELRDAMPIITSGSVPTLLLVLAWLTDYDGRLLQLVAAGVVVLRLAGIGHLVSHLSGRPVDRRSRWVGLVVAGISAVIVVFKVWLLH